MNEFEGFERWLVPILPLLSAVWLILLGGILLAPVQACIARNTARRNRVKTIPWIGAAYSIAFFLPWFYLMARINGKTIPRGVTIALYATLYILWVAVIGLYIFWAFNSIEYNYAFEEGRPYKAGIGLRTTIAFVATITACSVTLAYSLFGLIFERFSSFGEGGNKIKQAIVPSSSDALPYALCALWIPLLFSIGNFGSMIILAIGFAAWRVFCRPSVQRRNSGRPLVPDWREALPFAFFAMWILMFPVMWLITYGILSP